MKNIYKKETLETIVQNSKFASEVLNKLGLRNAGGNFKTLKKYCEMYNLDTSHFKLNHIEQVKILGKLVEIPLEKILVENSTYGSRVKSRLYKAGLKKRECELCNQGEIWKNKRMSLILDHINGVHSDNRIENLRIVCPNCNATLDTHCGKNIKKLKDKSLQKQYKPRLNRRKVNRPSLEELALELSNSNYCVVGRKYGVSDNAVRKWIKTSESSNRQEVPL